MEAEDKGDMATSLGFWAKLKAYAPTVNDRYGDGWLCFESDVEKRRLTPVPGGWRSLSDPELVQLLGQAQAVNRPKYSAEDRPNA